MMNVVWEYIVNFVEVILFYVFINQKLHEKKNLSFIKYRQYLFLAVRFLTVCIMNQINMNSIITLTISCGLEIIFACYFYNDRLLYKAFIGFLYTVFCMLAELIPFFCLTVFSDISSTDAIDSSVVRIPITILYLSLIAVFVFLSRYALNNEIAASTSQKLIYSVISLLGISVGHYILVTMITSESYGVDILTSRLAVIYLTYMVLFIALLFFIYQLSISFSNSQKLSELQAARSLEEQEYHNIMDKMSSLREMKHDMENHLNSLELMAKKLSSPEMQNYINDLRQNLESSQFFVSTGNMAVDCILSAKIATAKNTGIDIEYSILLPDGFQMDPVSVCSLLGNLWDNSIEACKKILSSSPNVNPFINFYIKPYQDMTIIHIDNNYVGIIAQKTNGDIVSTKENSEHGLGFKKIQNLVNSEQGIIQVDTQNQTFSVHILLPQKGV